MKSMQNPTNAPSIMIVEDDKVACELLATVIRRRFPRITTYLAENGRAGVEVFKQHSPEIVITDINMPEMDGIEMAGRIKSLKNDTKLIVITAYSNPGYVDKFAQIGVDDYLSKPVEFVKLFQAVEKCIDEIMLERK
ncbi:MAG: response regulator [Geobacter sp.]|nr:MAG: response regulator [Geobacter sp.]